MKNNKTEKHNGHDDTRYRNLENLIQYQEKIIKQQDKLIQRLTDQVERQQNPVTENLSDNNEALVPLITHFG